MKLLRKIMSGLPAERKEQVMLTDWSGSMAGAKEEALKKALKDLIPRHPATELIRFGGSVSGFRLKDVDRLRPGGGTPMGKALNKAWKMRVEKIILITDGQPTDWSTEKILKTAREYFFIPIHIIGIGDPHRTSYFDKGGLNEPFLKELARITGGSYNRVGEGELYTLAHKVDALLGYDDKRKGGSVIEL